MIVHDSADTIAGQLQRGLGRGARVVRDPALVEACLRQQYAWDWQVDSREEIDVPVLSAEIAWLDSRPDHLCGYDELVTGLARIGGPVVATCAGCGPPRTVTNARVICGRTGSQTRRSRRACSSKGCGTARRASAGWPPST